MLDTDVQVAPGLLGVATTLPMLNGVFVPVGATPVMAMDDLEVDAFAILKVRVVATLMVPKAMLDKALFEVSVIFNVFWEATVTDVVAITAPDTLYTTAA